MALIVLEVEPWDDNDRDVAAMAAAAAATVHVSVRSLSVDGAYLWRAKEVL